MKGALRRPRIRYPRPAAPAFRMFRRARADGAAPRRRFTPRIAFAVVLWIVLAAVTYML